MTNTETQARKFLAIITDFNNVHYKLPMRLFCHADFARDWVDAIHALMCEDCDKGKSDDYVETAYLYRVRKNGSFVLIDEFSGMDRGDGIRGGWENACVWQHEKGWSCSRSKTKGKDVCAFHAKPQNSTYCAPEEGFWTSTEERYKSKRARIAQLRADLKDDARPTLSFLRLLKAS